MSWTVVAAATAFTLWQLFPSKIFLNTTPIFGDFGGHLEAARRAGDDLLPQFRVSGWSMDWFTGMPVLTFYFPLGSLLVAVLGWLVPINIAIKVIAAAGPVTLPLAAYAFGRLEDRDRLTSACYAVCVLPLLLEPALHQSGGAVLASVSSGEFGYGLSLSLSLLTLGVARAGLRTGGKRALAAVLLAATILFHALPAVLLVAGMVVSAVMPPARARVRWLTTVFATAAALVAFWVVPFLVHGELTAGPEYERAVPILVWMVPAGMAPVAVLALLAVVIGLLAAAAGVEEWDRLPMFMTVMAVIAGLTFAVTPDGRVWNTRFLPLWFLWLCLLAGNGIAWVVRMVDEQRRARVRSDDQDVPVPVLLFVPPLLFALVLPVWASRLGDGLLLEEQGPATRFPDAVLSGYERNPGVRRHVEGVVETLRDIGREHGCGRAYWEWTEESWGDAYHTMSYVVPSMTDGCITVVDGLYAQSSATSTYVDVTNQRLSAHPVRLSTEPWDFDIEAGILDLQRLGVRYFLSSNARTRTLLATQPGVRRLADTEPYEGGWWRVYEVVNSGEVVEPLDYEPVVVPGIGESRPAWEEALTEWLQHEDGTDVVLAASGPDGWVRRTDTAGALPRQPVEPVTVSDVRVDDMRISFRVSRPGTPVLVKASYFPNWRADGADGPYRVMPNQMVVVPTSRTVTLRFGRHPVEHLSMLVTAGGLVAVGVLSRRPPLPMPAPVVEEPAAERPKRRPGTTKKKAKKRRR